MHYLLNEFDWQAANLLLGSTTLLGLACLAVCATGRAVWKQRLAELAVGLTLIWFVAAVIPMPRFGFPGNPTAVSASDQRQPSAAANRSSASTLPSPEPTVSPTGNSAAASRSVSTPMVESGPTWAAAADETQMAATGPAFFDAQRMVWHGFLIVSVSLAVWIVTGRVILAYSRRFSQPPPDWLSEIYDDLGVRRRASLRVSRLQVRPMSFGMFRPVILVPQAMCREANAQAIRHVLLHEQVHVDRADAFGNAVLNLSLPLLWFHPMYWYLRGVACFSRELIADDVAARSTDKLDYINDLVQLVRQPDLQTSRLSGAIEVLGFRHPFTRRMSLLLHRDQPLEATMKSGPTLGVASVGVAVMATAVLVFGAGANPAVSQTIEVDQQVISEATEQVSATEPGPEIDANEGEIAEAGKSAPKVNYQPLPGGAIARASNDLAVTAPNDGHIETIRVRAGAPVKKGELLMSLENLELTQAAAVAKKELEESKRAQINAIALKTAELELGFAEREFARMERAYKEASLPSLEYEKARAKVQHAKLRVDAANKNTEEQSLVSKQKELLYKLALERLDRLQIRTDFDGVVDSVAVRPSQSVRKGDRLCRVIGLETVRVEFYVDATKHAPQDMLHRQARFHFELPNDRTVALHGKVDFVSASVDLNTQMKVSATCKNLRDNGFWVVRDGMLGRVEVAPLEQPEAAGSPSPMLSGESENESLQQQELALVEKLVAEHTETLQQVEAQFESGVGTLGDKWMATRDLWWAKAKYAQVAGNGDEASEAFQKAIDAAEKCESVLRLEFQHGRVPASNVSQTQRIATEIKLEALRHSRSQSAN